MSTSEQILEQALALPPDDRAKILEQLLASFQKPPDLQLDELWVREAEDRIEAYDRGEIGSISAEEVFARLERQRFE